ncbi:hypothetical protein [Rhodococcus sp. PD04]|uniref:hypothetical protein n=1 Tax=Rhodococcus sp. PD04 TaxID=3109594 RepID=UPI002DD8AAEA|nr:hypothetical protein [Rhodococcus sp. PD04]WSE22356.1 hypothetical protein U9J23_22325 [Rhodococcus sp. PD04]
MTASLPVFEDTLADFWPIRNGEFVRSLAADLDLEPVRVIDVETETVPARLPAIVEHVEPGDSRVVELAPEAPRERLNTTTRILLGVFTLALAFVMWVGILP